MANSDKAEKASLKKFFDGVKIEFGKIEWPKKENLLKQSTAVIVISVITGVVIAILDMAFQYGVNFITSL